ncbi:MAG: HD domain-containing protein [Clostridia bacterium]|nr:HD domain-containing protein [Clostridia bacterium]
MAAGRKVITLKNPYLGLIFLLVGILFFCVYILVPKHEYGDLSVAYPKCAVFEDMSEDGSLVAVNDDYSRIYCFDRDTSEIRYIVNSEELSEKDITLREVFFDADNTLYMYATIYDGSGMISQQNIYRFATDGDLLGCYSYFDALRDAEYTQNRLQAFSVSHGIITFLSKDGNVYDIVSADYRNGTSGVVGHYSADRGVAVKWASPNSDGSFDITCFDGSIGHLKKNGTFEKAARFDYSLKSTQKGNLLVNYFVSAGDKKFIVDSSDGDTIYAFEPAAAGNAPGEPAGHITLRELYGIDEELSEEQYRSFLQENAIRAVRAENDMLALCSGANVFFLNADGTFTVLDGEAGFTLPGKYSLPVAARTASFYLFVIFALLGAISLLGSLMKWHLSVRSKMMLIIVPLVIASFGVITYSALFETEKDYIRNYQSEYAAISSLVVKNLDTELIERIDSLDDISNGNMEKLRLQLREMLQEETGWSNGITVALYAFSPEGFNTLIATTDESYDDFVFRNNYLMRTLQDMQDDRVGQSDTYEFFSRQADDRYIDAVTLVRNDGGEIIALLDVYSNAAEIYEKLNQIRADIIIRCLIFLLILIGFLLLLAMYINSSLKRTSSVINELAKGNFEYRVEKLSTDELGIIGRGINEMAEQIQRMLDERDEFSVQAMEALVGALDAKDNYTNGHSVRVAQYSREIAKRLGHDAKMQRHVYYAGLLHDIGKIGIPDRIINKEGTLTQEEYARIKDHTVIGNEILRKLPALGDIHIGAYMHHERYDGNGYPEGLEGDRIPEIARIISVADAYDAMTSGRSYRKEMPREAVRREIERGKRTQFDPQMAEIMLQIDADGAGADAHGAKSTT